MRIADIMATIGGGIFVVRIFMVGLYHVPGSLAPGYSNYLSTTESVADKLILEPVPESSYS